MAMSTQTVAWAVSLGEGVQLHQDRVEERYGDNAFQRLELAVGGKVAHRAELA